ncbi:MAG TPA: hypothetical protein PLD84_02165 [Chitinophagales bacterium]|nr:hypothetical protein [Chitinophagales bacterium]
MKKISGLITALSFLSLFSFAQVTTDKVVGQKNDQLIDSLKKAEYPYLLPIWGKKATEKGFNLQYPAGLSLNYLFQNSDLTIDNLQVGFNHGMLYNLDEIVRFDNAESTTNGVNIRPDIWLFPFLNVYGIFAKSRSSTEVGYGVWVPKNDSTWQEVFSTSTKAEFDGTSLGFGITPTMGIGGFFLILDMNCAWTDIDALEKPAFSFIFDPRIGKNFQFKQPEMSLAVWTGGFRIKINSGTTGSLNISDLFTTEEWGSQIDEGFTKITEGQQAVDDWWSNLSPAEQKNPINVAKYNTANAALEKASNVLVAADEAVNTAANSSIQYSLDKKQADMWNFIIGSQFQLNKHWMVRAEVGFLGSRTQVLGGLQYRFGL